MKQQAMGADKIVFYFSIFVMLCVFICLYILVKELGEAWCQSEFLN